MSPTDLAPSLPETAPTARLSRDVERIVHGQPTSDGAGVKLLRVLTQDLQRRLDPFLMLDEFRSDQASDYLAGFPDHPHRGFETVTYMLAGRMRHRDNAGNEGLLESGGAQWMTAGRGLIHSELPEQQDGLMHGFQLWVNLPAARKMVAPAYADLRPEQIPQLELASGVQARVLAGSVAGVAGPIQRPDTEPLFVDVRLHEAAVLFLEIPQEHHALIYVYQGAAQLGSPPRLVAERQMAVLGNQPGAQGLALQTSTPDTRLLLISGRPLHEPIAQWGPFVMNSRAEIEQAVRDYHRGALG